YMHKGQIRTTPDGTNTFDVMLYPEYMDYCTGRIGVMRDPPAFVHFSGTVATFRAFQRSRGQHVTDELFRLLGLAILEELIVAEKRERTLPSISELAEGLTNPNAPILYTNKAAAS